MSITELIPLVGVTLLTALQLVVFVNCRKLFSLFIAVLGFAVLLLYFLEGYGYLSFQAVKEGTMAFVLLDILATPLSKFTGSRSKCRVTLPANFAIIGIVFSMLTLITVIVVMVFFIAN